MAWMRSEARNGLRFCMFGLAAVAAAVVITSDAADARHHRRLRVHYVHVHREVRVAHRGHAEDYSPPTASIIVDGNSGEVLQASNPDGLRHPASLTKIMTLYLLFERLDAGRIRLDTPLKVSEHAAEQDPTKLNLKPGQSLIVEDAIKGVVTRSANDAAVVIAENIGGSEGDFAKLMTQKAHALGMSHTTYVNASGLPNDDQITTARDQALLGRAIQERFPQYYKYFSTRSFVYHGEAIGNHDHLLNQVQGVDGIKTGFTRASGFNLVTSLHRDGRYLVGVVLGGRSGAERDAHMRELLREHFEEASLKRTAPQIAEREGRHDQPQPVAFARAPLSAHADPAPSAPAKPRAVAGSSDPIQPLLVKTVSYRTAPVETAPLAPMPMLMSIPTAAAPPAAAPQSAVRAQPPTLQARAEAQRQVQAQVQAQILPQVPAQLAAQPKAQAKAPQGEMARTIVASADAAAAVPTVAPPAAPAPAPRAEKAEAAPTGAVRQAKAEIPDAEPANAVHARGGWLIQIGAYDGEDEARQHLTDAQIKARARLAAADPFTERVQKGDKALYRARFAGFDKATAEAACKELKRNDFECMALKN
jgi:D-alanyl-D-alanine carboxypeptidase